jgi:hypothetical protein
MAKHRSLFLGVVLAVALAICGKVHAQSADTIADVHCVIVGARLASSADANERSRGAMLLIYYLGRLDGRSPTLDLEHLVLSEAAHVTPAELQSETRRCSEALASKGQQITRIGNDLTRLGR